MRRLVLVDLLVALPLLVGPSPGGSTAQAAGTAWEPFVSFPASVSGRTDAVAIFADATLYVLGGQPYRCPSPDPCNDPELGAADYLPAGADAWLQGQPFDSRLQRLGGGADGLARPVAFGGAQGDAVRGSDKTFLYDVVAGEETEPTLERRNFLHTNFAWASDDRGRLYAIGGGPGALASAADPNTTDVERYDALTDTWTGIAPLPEARANAAATFDGQGHVLVFGGYDALASARATTVLSYHVASDAWSLLAELPLPAAGGNDFSDQRAVLGADGRVYVVGGVNGPVGAGTTRAQVYTYEPVTDTWGTAPDLSTPRHGAALARDEAGWIYALGGRYGGTGLSSSERLDTSPTGSECVAAPDCDDGLACNGAESCVDGFCLAGEPVVCAPETFCSADGLCQVQLYDLVDLGALAGGAASSAAGINAAGEVVGDFFDTTLGQWRAFLYDGALTDLGPGRARAIDDDGWIAGDDGTAFVIDPGTGARTDVGTLGGPASAAYGVTAGGWTVGQSDRAGSAADHAFLVRGPGAAMEDLGTLGDYSIAHGVNAAGRVVGESLVTSFDPHAEPFVFDASLPGATMTTLPGLFAAGSARAVNAAGHVTGWISNNVDAWGHAFVHDGATLTDLGSIPGKAYSIGTALNRHDHVVGYAFGEWVYTPCCGYLWSNAIKRAFVHDGLQARDLNEELPESSGWVLTVAAGINDSGAIVGTGTFAGQGHAFLLQPHVPVSLCGDVPCECADGTDNDDDGLVDHAEDPGCRGQIGRETSACQDGEDGDSDGLVDFDGGVSIHGACAAGSCPEGVSDPDGDGVADPDPHCIGKPWRTSERGSSCGLGGELLLALTVLAWLRRREGAASSR